MTSFIERHLSLEDLRPMPVSDWMRRVAETRPLPLSDVYRFGVGLRERLRLRTGRDLSDDELQQAVEWCADAAATLNLPFPTVIGRLGGTVPLDMALGLTPEER